MRPARRPWSLHIQQGHHDAALALLSSLLRGDVRLDGEAVDARNPSDWRHEAERLLEKFSPQLIVIAPVQLVDVWIQAAYLEPQRLLPAIMSYEQRYEHGQLRPAGGELPHQGIRYLQHCVDEAGCDNEAVCNCLVLLHAKHSSDAQLFEYLSGVRQEGGAAADADASGIRAAASDAAAATEALGIGLASLEPSYDAQYALRVCRELNRHEGCVLIYQRRGMHAEAVDLALSLGRLDLAKRSANSARADSAEGAARRKRLWLQVAAHVVSAADGASVHRALALIAECSAPGDEPLLQLEDLLPLFPDFTIIDDFKEPVCSSLASYAERMKELRAEMDDAVSACAELRTEIEKVEGRQITVPSHQPCDCKELASLDITTCCGQSVGGHRHIAYPCQHAFRVACLLATLKDRAVAFDEEGLAAECPLCGEFMVESISRPFVDAQEVQAEGSWAIDEARVYSLD
ncbi:hypothetical protein AB1Y20_016525 [Prymnesium parvum]|uniref:RING-type domain-containing protein n=1 Tax=Prymnesium parvum TaxID=97485 RepID=A0AB34ICR5_PRYPA